MLTNTILEAAADLMSGATEMLDNYDDHEYARAIVEMTALLLGHPDWEYDLVRDMIVDHLRGRR